MKAQRALAFSSAVKLLSHVMISPQPPPGQQLKGGRDAELYEMEKMGKKGEVGEEETEVERKMRGAR